jgi:Spy/CpxP family protein refolding chaperone
MKRILPVLIAATGLLVAIQAEAQSNEPPVPPAGHAERHFNMLSQELNLTPQQKPQVQAILQEMRQKIRAAVQEARTNADSQLQQVLTQDQYQKLQNIWQQHPHRHWGHNNMETNDTENAEQ